MYYQDEDKSKKGFQESPFFTADEGTLVWILHLRALKYINVCPGKKPEIVIEKDNLRRNWYVRASLVSFVVIKPRCGKEKAQESGRQKISPSGNNLYLFSNYSGCRSNLSIWRRRLSPVNFTLNHVRLCTYIPSGTGKSASSLPVTCEPLASRLRYLCVCKSGKV